MVCLTLFAVKAARAAGVTLSGDLGSVNFNTPFFLAINGSSTTPFAHTIPGRGSITGDVISNNVGGTSFDMTITNLTLTGTNSPYGGTYVTLTVLQNYATLNPNGTYAATHDVNGSWSMGLANYIQCDSLHDFGGSNTSLPMLQYSNNPNPTPAFGGPAVGASVSNQIGVYSIRSTIQFFIDGDGFIDLPNSYHVDATVPEPTSAAMLGIVGVMGLRRRRA